MAFRTDMVVAPQKRRAARGGDKPKRKRKKESTPRRNEIFPRHEKLSIRRDAKQKRKKGRKRDQLISWDDGGELKRRRRRRRDGEREREREREKGRFAKPSPVRQSLVTQTQ